MNTFKKNQLEINEQSIDLYSSVHKSSIFCFAQLLLHTYHGQLSKPGTKLSLKVRFGQDLPKIIKVKDIKSISENV